MYTQDVSRETTVRQKAAGYMAALLLAASMMGAPAAFAFAADEPAEDQAALVEEAAAVETIEDDETPLAAVEDLGGISKHAANPVVQGGFTALLVAALGYAGFTAKRRNDSIRRLENNLK